MGQDEKALVRATVFGHLAGIVLAPTVKALADRKVFDSSGLLPAGWTSIKSWSTRAETGDTCVSRCGF